MTAGVCHVCHEGSALTDEHGRCERCVLAASRVASALGSLEEHVADILRGGVTVGQLRAALEHTLRDSAGSVSELLICREPVATSERGIWTVEPSSAFLGEPDDPEPNQLRHLRHLAGITLEDLADRVGETPERLALYEVGGLIDFDVVERCAAVFAVDPWYLVGGVT